MIIRPCILIPTYNNSQTIRKVVLDCVTQTECPVLIIDDGSEEPVMDLLTASPPAQGVLSQETVSRALVSGRLHLLRFPKNRGKGAAIQKGFCFAIEKNFTHLITMDADGQHLVSEIPKFLEASLQDPWALIIGNRQLTDRNVPRSTKFGRAFSNFWVKYETGTLIHDSQSGFRVYPLFHVQNMSFWTRHYDFEIEVLIRLLWKNIPVREIPIAVFYPSKKERVSHFRKFWDNARITLLNTFLVFLSLLRGSPKPFKSALALSLGVFVGCTPFFGFHTPIALALAFLLRLNLPLLWIGTQVSFPFLAPFLAITSVAIGRTLKGEPFLADGSRTELFQESLRQAASSFQDWFLGSLILGFFLGALVYAGTWVLCGRMKVEKPRPWTGKSRGGRFGPWILKTLIRFLGVKTGYFFLFFIVPYFFLFLPQGRRGSLEYWRIVRPSLKGWKRPFWVLRHFYRFGTILVDRAYQSYFPTAKFHTESHGYENIYHVLSPGSGAILLGAHVGAWEMASKYLPVSELEDRFFFIQYLAPGLKPEKDEEQKGRFNVLYLNREEGAVMKMHALLREGKMICLMGDRPMDDHYELVPFFGKLAPFAATPFKIAATCQVPLVISFGFKKDEKTYHLMALSGKHYAYEEGKERNVQILEWVEEYAMELEKVLKDFPDQWFNFYPFWSSCPVSSGHSPAKRGRNHLATGGNRRTADLSVKESDPTKIASLRFPLREKQGGRIAKFE